MNSVFEVQKTIREIFLKVLDHHSLEQLNKIPFLYLAINSSEAIVGKPDNL